VGVKVAVGWRVGVKAGVVTLTVGVALLTTVAVKMGMDVLVATGDGVLVGVGVYVGVGVTMNWARGLQPLSIRISVNKEIK
jgi:hypothetical protein